MGKVSRKVLEQQVTKQVKEGNVSYAGVKGTLLSKHTPQSAKDDFVIRVMNQLEIEAKTYYDKHQDKALAQQELIKTITDDKSFMEILAIVKITVPMLEERIKTTLDKIIPEAKPVGIAPETKPVKKWWQFWKKG